MISLRLYMAQRIAALIMIPLVLGHLALMIFAIQGGLTTAEILGRTQGSVFWFVYYGTFVVAVSVHASLGLRVIALEWLGLPARWLMVFTWALCSGLIIMGARAVLAVTLT